MSIFWVGEINGLNYVFDPQIQIQGCSYVFLWNTKLKQMDIHSPEATRPLIKSQRNELIMKECIELYSTWKSLYAESWIIRATTYFQQDIPNHSSQPTAFGGG